MNELQLRTAVEANFFETGWLLSDPEAGLVHFGTGDAAQFSSLGRSWSRPRGPVKISDQSRDEQIDALGGQSPLGPPDADTGVGLEHNTGPFCFAGPFASWRTDLGRTKQGHSLSTSAFRSWVRSGVDAVRGELARGGGSGSGRGGELASGGGKGSHSERSWSWSHASRQSFTSIFCWSREQIQSGAASKLVPVLFDHAESNSAVGPLEIANWLERSLDQLDREGVWIYGRWYAGAGLIGATPELLFRGRRSGSGWELLSMALAGTAPKGDSNWPQEKDLREHQEVVADVLEVWPGARAEEARQIQTSTGLRHLRTNIYHEFANPNFLDMVEALHPTAALGAKPRARLSELLAREPEPRDEFGAPILVVTSDRVLAVVAIRGFRWSGRHLRLGAGGGLVAQSQLEPEWQEQLLKRASVRRFWGLE